LLLRGSMLARMGGDEFTVVIPEVSKPEDAETVARHILRAFSRPFEVNGREQFVSASIGLCFYPEDAKTPSDLLRCADVAVYRAKAAGKGLFRRYNASMNRATERQLRIQNELHRAIEREELSLDYQAQFSMEDRALTGAEALLRWNSAALGPTGPSEFIPVAETSGLVIPVGKWALDRVCRQIADWERSGRVPITVAVNVSAIQFAERDFLECIWSVLQKHQIDPYRLVLELTESSIMRDYEESAAKIGILRQIGVSVAIDDFGTGYSSLSSLERLHPDSLKIDKSFIQRIAPSEPRPAIVKAIIGLAHSLGMRVVAEGIETDYQLKTLREFGCHAGQGYLLSAPLAGEAFQELLSA
ncbi:MAG TPA: bifunctional diguanylate cyclase/phosphodiesterase, partial [Bryobacteraceae bacterium]|nr:bifunctional diguanylate cyclase/phosphodiesterase [Bryobacteraceae bacterium]